MIKIQSFNRSRHFYPDEHSGICVVRHEDESFDDFIKRFRKKYTRSGISRELKQRMQFEKPSNKKRRKKAQSIRLRLKEQEKAEQFHKQGRIDRLKSNRKKMKGRYSDD